MRNSFALTSILSAIAASLCCITPVLALISGASGVASSFSWMEPFRPYLLGITVLVLGFAWNQKLKPRSADKIQCDCETACLVVDKNEKQSLFMQSKLFLGIITVFAFLMMLFPYYTKVFYPKQEIKTIANSNFKSVEFKINGMTCEACASHIASEVNKVNGVFLVTPSFKNKNISIQFDTAKTNENEIVKTINATGYKVKSN